jgi:ADP-dependent NAD(P)H-hydrate dehydratase
LDAANVDRVGPMLLMTPNRQEARSLITDPPSDDDDVLSSASRATGAVLASFGGVHAPDGRRWQSDIDAVGLGTSGSGDVLAGLAGGAAARCGDRAQAACWATYAHLEAGRRLEERVGVVGYLATDILREVPGCLSRATVPDD